MKKLINLDGVSFLKKKWGLRFNTPSQHFLLKYLEQLDEL